MEFIALGLAAIKLLSEAVKAYKEVREELNPKPLPPSNSNDMLDSLVAAYTQRISYLEQDRRRLREEVQRLKKEQNL
jgi:hypothetical protein